MEGWRAARVCASTQPGHEGMDCTPGFRVQYGENPILSSPQQNWVEMTYRVEAGQKNPAVIEVYQNGRFIVVLRAESAIHQILEI